MSGAALGKWEHLFYGEYAEREKIFSGLTLEQVTARPAHCPHSIFDELWHTVLWQNILVTRDEALYERSWEHGVRYPEQPPTDIRTWSALVDEFLDGLRRAIEWTVTPERLNTETDPGVTMADVLHGLAVHNAYHLGKIVALRQMLGLWPPP